MERRFGDLLESVRDYNPDCDFDLLRRAYDFSAAQHRDQVRRSGEPYLTHPLAVAMILVMARPSQRSWLLRSVGWLSRQITSEAVTSSMGWL